MASIPLAERPATYQATLDDFVEVNQIHHSGGFLGYFKENFPAPTRLQVARWIRCCVHYTIVLIMFWVTGERLVDGKYLQFIAFLGALFGFLIAPTSHIMGTVVMVVVIALGVALGLALSLVLDSFIVLYNNSSIQPKTVDAYAGMVLSWLAVIVYIFSFVQFRHSLDPLGGLALAIMSVNLIVIEKASVLQTMTSVSGNNFILLLFVVLAGIIAIIVGTVILPEHPTEDARLRILSSIEHMKRLLDIQMAAVDRKTHKDSATVNITPESFMIEVRTRYNHLLSDTSALQAALKAAHLQLGWLYDSPHDITRVATALNRCVRHMGTAVESVERGLLTARKVEADGKEMQAGASLNLAETVKLTMGWLDEALSVVHDALLVQHGILGNVGVTSQAFVDPMLPNADLSQEWNRIEASKEPTFQAVSRYGEAMRKNWPVERVDEYFKSFDRSDVALEFAVNTQMYSLGISCLLKDVDELCNVVKQVQQKRNLQRRTFYYPGKSFPKQPKTKKNAPPKQKKAPLTWSGFWNDLLFAIHRHFDSDASHFAFRRTLSVLLISMFAFIPNTQDFFLKNHGYWVVLSNLLIMSPTVGATINRLTMRFLGVIIGCLWGYFSALAFPTYFAGAYAFIAPIALVSFYLVTCTNQAYIGTCIVMSYCIVALGSNGDAAQLALYRSIMTMIGCILGFIGSLIVYPMLARSDARIAFGNVLFNLTELFQRVNNLPMVPSDKLKETQDYQHSLAIYQGTQGLLTATRSLTLYNAAGEPDLDRPYSQQVMEAVGASIQRLMDSITAMNDAFVVGRSSYSLETLQVIHGAWDEKRTDILKTINMYYLILANTLLTKAKLPSEESSPRYACRRVLTSSWQFTDFIAKTRVVNDGVTPGFLLISVLSTMVTMIAELEMLEDLLVRIYGRQSWFVRQDNWFNMEYDPSDIAIVKEMRPLKEE
jgi:hypothetical protein